MTAHGECTMICCKEVWTLKHDIFKTCWLGITSNIQYGTYTLIWELNIWFAEYTENKVKEHHQFSGHFETNILLFTYLFAVFYSIFPCPPPQKDVYTVTVRQHWLLYVIRGSCCSMGPPLPVIYGRIIYFSNLLSRSCRDGSDLDSWIIME